MQNVLSLLVLSVIAAAPIVAQDQRSAHASDGRSRDIYVSVLDSKGVPVTGLTAADFTVREDGANREVLRAVPATDPLDLVLLVDDSQAATRTIPYLRDGLNRFIDRMQGKASIGIVTVGERPTSIVERTTDAAALKKGVNRIFARQGAGAYLLEGITEVTRGFRMRESKRPVIVAISVEGIEFSNSQYERVLDDLYKSGAALHVLAIGSPVSVTSDEIRNKNMVVSEGTAQTGGRRDQLLSELAIPDALGKVAGELLNQYLVTYARPESIVPPEKVQVGVKRTDLTVRARTRLPAK